VYAIQYEKVFWTSVCLWWGLLCISHPPTTSTASHIHLPPTSTASHIHLPPTSTASHTHPTSRPLPLSAFRCTCHRYKRHRCPSLLKATLQRYKRRHQCKCHSHLCLQVSPPPACLPPLPPVAPTSLMIDYSEAQQGARTEPART
jgi:hypothetical protein